ncbi:MAG: DUF2207 domain-containing protein [Candidatus Saccharimonas sp.]
MKKFLIFVGAIFVLLSGLVVATPSTVEAKSTNNFRISKYDIHYTLSRDSENRSTLQTTEKIVAQFPNENQNHGIERFIPTKYDKHSISLKITSVVDENNKKVSYDTYTSGNGEVVRIGDAHQYVHGEKTYIISYSQRDVTKFYANTSRDEFYWDTNGTDWRVPIDSLSVTLSIDDALKENLVGNVYCYKGAYQSNESCDITKTSNQIATTVSSLSAGENVTLAIGFNEGTFAPYKMSDFEKFIEFMKPIWAIAAVVSSFIGMIITIAMSIKWYRTSRRKKELGTIIPEYLPPKDASVTVSAMVLSSYGSTFAAQLIDFAVRHYIKIYETKQKSFLSGTEYDIEIARDITPLHEEEKELLNDIFSGNVQIGSRIALSDIRKKYAIQSSLYDNTKKLKQLAREKYKLYYKDDTMRQPYKTLGIVFAIIGVVTVNVSMFMFAAICAVLGYTLWVYTDKGLALNRYLLGLKEYITVAEVERLKMLQSPSGAEKVGAIDPSDSSQMVKLYEKVLPYAILFGQEKEWNKELEHYYTATNSQPDWFIGTHAAFSAAAFSSAISSFSASASASVSSSSGGSSGGGFSGGGGGGGGGGGW